MHAQGVVVSLLAVIAAGIFALIRIARYVGQGRRRRRIVRQAGSNRRARNAYEVVEIEGTPG